MNWFTGSIAEAVALSKEKNSIFVVYVEGNDELSQKLRGFINEDKIRQKLESDCFVAIRVEGGSQAYMQFAQIYQLVPLPSLFFIGKNGAPIEIATGVITSADELESKINRVLAVAGLKIDDKEKLLSESAAKPTTSTSASASANLISNEQAASTSTSSDIVCEGNVCYRKPKESVEEKLSPGSKKEPEISQPLPEIPNNPENNQPKDETTEKVERAKKLLEEKRKEKEAEEARLEREREIKRRKEGQEVQSLKKWKQEHELKELKDSIRKGKLEDQAARQRILEKIASDKAERAQKFGQIPTQKQEQPAPKPVSISQPISHDSFESSRIQFKKPDGESEMHTFKSSDCFQVVRDYVKDTILQGTGIREFSLAMTFPRKEFTSADDNQTLSELGLCPTAVLLVITRTNTGPAAVVSRSGGFVNIFNTVFWGILSPFFLAFSYIRGLFTGHGSESATSTGAQKRANENSPDAHDLAKKRSLDRFAGNGVINDYPSTSTETKATGKTIPYRRVGNSNIHRLRDQRDSDDENNTWNGNSTQQQ